MLIKLRSGTSKHECHLHIRDKDLVLISRFAGSVVIVLHLLELCVLSLFYHLSKKCQTSNVFTNHCNFFYKFISFLKRCFLIGLQYPFCTYLEQLILKETLDIVCRNRVGIYL